MTHTCEIMGIRSPACVLTGSVLALCRRNGSLLLSRPVPANRCVYFPLCPLSHTAYVIEIPQVLFDLTQKAAASAQHTARTYSPARRTGAQSFATERHPAQRPSQ